MRYRCPNHVQRRFSMRRPVFISSTIAVSTVQAIVVILGSSTASRTLNNFTKSERDTTRFCANP
jgi:hypothetical protein